MTEIKAGNSFTASTRLVQEMHKAAEDGTVDAKELARLAQIALDDSSGLTEDEQKMLSSLYSGDIDTTGLNESEQNAIAQLQKGGSGVSAEVVDKNIKSLQSLKAHENDPKQLDFSSLQLISETKSFLSRASFGLFGGSSQTSHVVRISDGNIPTVNNPQETTTMAERSQVERENLVNTLSPLNQELQAGLADPNSDIRQRFAEFLSPAGGPPLDPGSEAVTQKIQELSNKIQNFEDDPTKSNWTTSDDLTALMNSYATNPPENNARLNSGYMQSLLGAFWNASDASYFSDTQRHNFEQGNIQTPASTSEINEQLSQVNTVAAEDMQEMLTKTSNFINQLDGLKESNPELYQQVLRGTDESGLDFLRAQVSDLKQHQQNGGVITQAQVNQLNNISASFNELRKTLDFGPTPEDRQSLDMLNQMMNDPTTPEEAKPELQKEIDRLLQDQKPPLPAEQQALLDDLRTAQSTARSSVYSSLSSAEDASEQRSNMIFELENAENTLIDLLSQHGISEPGRVKLQSQLTATQRALEQLRNNQPLSFETPEVQADFEQVLNNVQKLRPEPESTNTTDFTTAKDFGVGFDLTQPFGSGRRIPEVPGINLPELELDDIGFSTGLNLDDPLSQQPFNVETNTSSGIFNVNLTDNLLSSSSLYGSDPLGLYGSGFSSGSLLGSSWGGFNDYGLYSPSLGYGGLSGGLGGYNSGSPILSLPSMAPSPASGADTPRPSLSNIFLEDIGENPDNVTRIDPALQGRQSAALETVQSILSDQDASEEAKTAAEFMQKILNNEGDINMTLPSGSLEASISVLESYKDLKDMGVSTTNAEVVFMLAARGMRAGETPQAIAQQIQGITASGTPEQITERLKDTRTEYFVENQKNIMSAASDLKDSEVFQQAAEKLLGKSENLTAEDITQLINHPDFQDEFGSVKGALDEKLETLNQSAASLVDQVRNSGLARSQSVRNIDDAIQVLQNSPSTPENARLMAQLQEVKQASEALAPQIAGIEQLTAVNRNYTTVLAEMDQAISALQSVEGSEAAMQLATLTELQAEFRQNGFLTETQARDYADLRENSRMHAFEAALVSDPEQTPQGRHAIQGLFSPLFQAGTPQDRDIAFSSILEGMTNGNINPPRRTHHQNRVLEALGLPPTDHNLSPQDFLTRLREYVPSAQMQKVIGQHADIATGRQMASYTLTGEPSLEEIDDMRSAYVTSAMTMDNGPDALAARAAEGDRIAANLLEYNQVAEESRQAAYSSEDPAAAFAALYDNRMASEAIFSAMDQAIQESVDDLRLANDNMMVANGYPPLGSASEPGRITGAQPSLSPRTQSLINEANALGDSLILAPVPSAGGEDFLNNLINDFIDIIRDLDYKTRQLVLQQLAQQMTNNAITQFYKDKVDEGNDYHQQALDRLSENFKEQIERTIESGLASQAESSQGVAAVSGQVTGAALANALERVGARENIAQMLDITTQMNPPLSQQQQERILDAVTRIMEAGGVPPLTDSQLGLPGLSNPLLRDQVVS